MKLALTRLHIRAVEVEGCWMTTLTRADDQTGVLWCVLARSHQNNRLVLVVVQFTVYPLVNAIAGNVKILVKLYVIAFNLVNLKGLCKSGVNGDLQ